MGVQPVGAYTKPVGAGEELSTVGFLEQIVTFVGAGEGRSGVGTLASPMGNRTQGDPRVPTLPPCHPRPYEAKRLPCSFHKIPTLESGGGEEWGGDACVAPGEEEPTHRNQGDANVPTGQRERKNNLDSRTI